MDTQTLIGILTLICCSLSSWALLKVIGLAERVVKLETQRTSDHEMLKEIKSKVDRIADKVGA